MKVRIESYGCSSSQAEAEIMAGLLKKAGYSITERSADLSVIVTCYVKKPTEQKMLYRIKELSSKPLIIAGCMSEGLHDKLTEQFPRVSLLSTHQITRVADAVRKILSGSRVDYTGPYREKKLCRPRVRKNPLIGIVPISSGCNSSCSYCCVKLAKGNLRSYHHNDIIKDVNLSLKDGCKEIWITAQDTASYGLDNGSSLPKLLTDISNLNGDFVTRVGMMNPRNAMPMLDDILKSFQSDRIFKFFHLPIQSGSDSVLSSMNRGYMSRDVVKSLEKIRKAFRCQIWTDVIVGYPTESDDDFEETMETIRKMGPDCANISKFGARPGTEASKLKPLSPKKVNDRSRKLSELVRSMSLKNNIDWLGWEGDIVITESWGKDRWMGRNFAYKPILVESKENIMGRKLSVGVSGAFCAHLRGDVLHF